MPTPQPGVLAPIPAHARYLTFSLRAGVSTQQLKQTLTRLAAAADGRQVVAGLGAPLVATLGASVPGLKTFEPVPGSLVDLPATQTALWLWLRTLDGQDPGDLLHRTQALETLLAPALTLDEVTDAFKYRSGHDLTGFEDGTENPSGDDAVATALVHNAAAGLNGSSFVAVQRWQHNLAHFQSLGPAKETELIGRDRESNEEDEDAPETAHVKRTAQENFELSDGSQAFMLRRSMPWMQGSSAGLVFVAFGRSLEAFEILLASMTGARDGQVDGLFQFSQPQSGAYFWCPALREGRLDLSPLGL